MRRRLILNLVEGLVVILVSLILVLSAQASTAQAQNRSVIGERFDISLTVQKNGDVDVVETRTIEFQGGPFHSGFRTIPLSRLDGITDVGFYEGGRRYERSDSEAPYTFRTWVEGGEFNLRWYFPQTSDSTHRFILKYTAKGAVRIYEGGDQLWWAAVESDRSYPVRTSQVTVHLPKGMDEVHKWEFYGVAGQGEVTDPQTIVFTTQETIRPGQGFEVRVWFPHGVVEAPPPAWQGEFNARVVEQHGGAPPDVVVTDPPRQVINFLAGFIGLFIAVIGTVGLVVLWYIRGRDASVPLVADYLPQPPSDLPPGVVGTLLDETADMQDIVATTVDLARRGVFTMQEIREEGSPDTSARHDFVFEKQDHEETLRPFENTLLQELFGGRQSQKLSSLLGEKFHNAILALQDQLYEEVVREGFFRQSPDSTRRIYTLLGVAGILFSIVSFLVLAVAVPFAEAALWISFGIGAVAIGMIVFGYVMPGKTTKGSKAAARWRAFKRYLENIENYTDLEQAKGIFDKYLPYAIAFGLEKSWMQKFAQVNAPTPRWYQPAAPRRHARPISPDLPGPIFSGSTGTGGGHGTTTSGRGV
ncbi:MAG: DUF2207 domain-containing protein, partial [Anaerolineae bacterium]